MSPEPTPGQADLRLEVIPHFTDVTPRAQELAELYLNAMGELVNYDPNLVPAEIDRMRGAAIVTLIDENERVVAMGGLVQPLGSSEGTVVNLATASEYQKRGLATIVLGEIARLAAYEGLTHLSVSSTPASDSLYERNGFDRTKSPMWRTKKL